MTGGKNLGGARLALGGCELVREGGELRPSDALSNPSFLPLPSEMNMGLGAFSFNQGSRAQGPAPGRTSGFGDKPGLGPGR